MSTAFVTGGTGLLGRRLIERLISDGWTVRALHRAAKDSVALRNAGAVPVQGDLSDIESLRAAIGDARFVFHCAALFTMWAPVAAFRQANVEGTRNLLTVAREAGVECFVQVGASGVVMGNGRHMRRVTEQAPLTYPKWAPYLASKAQSQELVLKANTPGVMRAAVVLPPLIWGPGMPMLDGVIDDVKAGRFAWPNGGDQIASTAHVDNVCHCVVLAAERSPGGQSYFVTDGQDRSLRSIITQLAGTRRVKIEAPDVPLSVAWYLAIVMEFVWGGFGLKGHPPLTRQMLRMIGYDFTLSDRLAREELGYDPIITWEAGIAQMQQV